LFRRPIFIAAIFLIAASFATTRAARAQPPGEIVSLRWNAPPTCPDRAYIQGEIQRLLGERIASSADRSVEATATVTRSHAAWRVKLVMRASGGVEERVLDGESCLSVANGAALVVALLVNPERVAHAASAAPAPPAPRSSSPPVEETAQRPRSTPPREGSGSEIRASTFVVGAADIGTVDKVGVGAQFGVSVGWPRLRFEATALSEPDHNASITRPGAGAKFRKEALGGQVCAAPFAGTWEIAGCGRLGMNFLQGSSYGIRSTTEGRLHWWEVGAGAQLRWNFAAKFGLRLEGSAGLPLRRPNFVVTTSAGDVVTKDVVHTIPVIVGLVQLGLEARF
jgi:hypothetical protein